MREGTREVHADVAPFRLRVHILSYKPARTSVNADPSARRFLAKRHFGLGRPHQGPRVRASRASLAVRPRPRARAPGRVGVPIAVLDRRLADRRCSARRRRCPRARCPCHADARARSGNDLQALACQSYLLPHPARSPSSVASVRRAVACSADLSERIAEKRGPSAKSGDQLPAAWPSKAARHATALAAAASWWCANDRRGWYAAARAVRCCPASLASPMLRSASACSGTLQDAMAHAHAHPVCMCMAILIELQSEAPDSA